MPDIEQKTMKAAMFYGAGDIRIEEVEVPKPSDGHVLVKVAWCGICGTEGPILCPDKTPHPITGCTLPVCLGHEFSGVVVQVGPNVKGDWKDGDRVVIESVISCGGCYACKRGCNNGKWRSFSLARTRVPPDARTDLRKPAACSKLGFVGLSGNGGGLAEYFSSPEEYLHHLPDNVSLKTGAMCEPLAVAIHAVRRAGFQKGMTALVLGAGPIGIFITKVLIAQGASKVICSEPSSTRREKAKLAGAHHLFSPLETDIVAEVRKLTGSDSGVDLAFEAAANERALVTAIKAVKTRGTVLNVSVWSREPRIPMNELVFSEKAILGASCYRDDHPAVMDALSSGSIKLEQFITATIPLEQLVEGGFRELLENNEQHVKILVSPSGQMDQPF
ncbi:alcohol dehydrogenase GroES domain protein [Rhodotorula sp. JG-1b]|nr:alcohol dehydrogenase GroES domain protein [Rhodotorula sp. JG-1b]